MEGHPLVVSCKPCRSSWRYEGGFMVRPRGLKCKPTGRVKAISTRRWPSGSAAEMVCGDCNHVFWSTHPMALGQAARHPNYQYLETKSPFHATCKNHFVQWYRRAV